MANPQVEDGRTEIANDIQDAFCRTRIAGEERQVLDCILRKTYGWHKVEDAISLSQFADMTGMKKPAIVRAIKGLLSKKIIIVIKKDNAPAQIYRFNKDYDQWEPLSKKITLSKKIKTVIKKDNPSLSFLSTTKATTTKANIYIVEQVISYLNEKTGKNFSPKTKQTISHINARLSEGRTLEDFQRVIDNKSSEWAGDPHWSKFLRPETLFAGKFESYLNEQPAQKAQPKFTSVSGGFKEW